MLMFGRRRFRANLVHLRTWGEYLGCSSQGNSKEKAWVRVVGLPVHLWSRKILEKIGDACGGFLPVDEDTDMLAELCWARVLVKLGKFEPSNTIEVMVGGTRFWIQLWWELSPSRMTVSSSEQRRNPRFCKGDDGGTRTGERVSLGGSAIAAGDVGDKHPVLSTQNQRRTPGQSSGQQAGQVAGRRDG